MGLSTPYDAASGSTTFTYSTPSMVTATLSLVMAVWLGMGIASSATPRSMTHAQIMKPWLRTRAPLADEWLRVWKGGVLCRERDRTLERPHVRDGLHLFVHHPAASRERETERDMRMDRRRYG